MGLTIHYSLKAKGRETQAMNLVTQLHRTAQDLPFKELGEIVEVAGDACDYNKRDKDDPLRGALIEASGSVRVKGTHRMFTGGMGDSYVTVIPTRVICFSAWPGDGCEESNFGLCQYPAEIFSPSFGRLKTRMSGWLWKSFCKTQYASNPDCGGVANFLRCHLTLVALLDKAKELGCLYEAYDEGGFWEKRDVPALVKEIGSWNQFIAAFGGKLKDVLGDGLECAISEYPNFEQLEAAGESKLPPETNALARLIQQVVKERRAL
jgi:hypothetical protein